MDILGRYQRHNMDMLGRYQRHNIDMLGRYQRHNMDIFGRYQRHNKDILGRCYEYAREMLGTCYGDILMTCWASSKVFEHLPLYCFQQYFHLERTIMSRKMGFAYITVCEKNQRIISQSFVKNNKIDSAHNFVPDTISHIRDQVSARRSAIRLHFYAIFVGTINEILYQMLDILSQKE